MDHIIPVFRLTTCLLIFLMLGQRTHIHGGSNKPSLEDLNNYYGVVSIIISYPYDYSTTGAFDRNGRVMDLEIVDSV